MNLSIQKCIMASVKPRKLSVCECEHASLDSNYSSIMLTKCQETTWWQNVQNFGKLGISYKEVKFVADIWIVVHLRFLKLYRSLACHLLRTKYFLFTYRACLIHSDIAWKLQIKTWKIELILKLSITDGHLIGKKSM